MKRGRSKAAAAQAPTPPQAAPAPVPASVYTAGPAAAGLWLRLEGAEDRAAPGNAAEAALWLDDAEPLLAALETWLHGSAWAAPDWRWHEGARADPHQALALAHWQHGATGPRVALGLPWAMLRSLPPPPVALGLQWQAAAACAVLAQPMLAADERAALEPGGALLLRAAFEPRWLGRLRAAVEPPGQGLAVAWVAGGQLQPQPLPGAAQAAQPGSAAPSLELRCFSRAPLPAEVLAGWAQLPARPEPMWEDEASLWACVQAAGEAAERCLARGRLMPWGRGQALSITAVGDDPAP